MTAILPAFCDTLCVIGLVQQAWGSWLVRPPKPLGPAMDEATAITVLKPLHGTEPLIDVALESFFLLDHPRFQIVFGIADADDPVLAVVENLRRRYPHVDTEIVTGGRPEGRNRKVANLIEMLPAAKHELLVISDADMHVAPDFLRAVTSGLSDPATGLATTLYTAIPATDTLAGRLGAMQVNHAFLPGAALARMLGREDCLGATMALRRAELETIGGFGALLDHLADDNVLGQRIRAAGRHVALAPAIPATSIPEASISALFRHELRWARTVRALVPIGYFGVMLQFPLFWAFAALLLTGLASWAWIFFAVASGLRYGIAAHLEHRLGFTRPGKVSPFLAKTPAPWLFLLRDMLSAAIFLASFWSDTVEWRGNILEADSGSRPDRKQQSSRPAAHELGSMR